MNLQLKVSDPWDLGEFLGWKELTAVLRHQEQGAWLVELDEPFEYEGIEHRYIVLQARQEGSVLADVRNHPEVACNMIRTSVERAESERPCDVSWWRGGNAMIGTVTSLE